MDTESLELVVDHIERHPNAYELTAKKIRERAVLIDDPERPGSLVFEVERHRSILGGGYVPGLPMAAYVTYWPRFAFEPQTDTLECIGEFRESETHIDCYALAETWMMDISFDFEPAENGKHRCRELCCCETRLVSDQSEVEEFAAEIVRGTGLTWIEDVIDAEYSSKCVAELRSALVEAMQEKAVIEWDWYVAQGMGKEP